MGESEEGLNVYKKRSTFLLSPLDMVSVEHDWFSLRFCLTPTLATGTKSAYPVAFATILEPGQPAYLLVYMGKQGRRQAYSSTHLSTICWQKWKNKVDEKCNKNTNLLFDQY